MAVMAVSVSAAHRRCLLYFVAARLNLAGIARVDTDASVCCDADVIMFRGPFPRLTPIKNDGSQLRARRQEYNRHREKFC